MTAVEVVAAAVHGIIPDPPRFPAIGRITSIAVRRAPTGAGPVTSADVVVTISGTRYEAKDVGATGVFLAELDAAGTDYTGREVIVDSVGGRLWIMTSTGGVTI